MYYLGVDYYPEHWPEERWPTDARLMAEAGFNVVRLAEFAWSRLEPEENVFNFVWLDQVIDVLAEKDIRVVLGTPTASPPPWLMAKSDKLFRVRDDGHRLTYGNRREYCPNYSLYWNHSQHIVSEMAEHYKDHTAVIGWQIDNEFGDRCYCDICRKAFQEWLQNRYGTLEKLNEKWGTIFWSHLYTDWRQIPLPSTTGNSPNPGLGLDFSRFVSDSYRAYQKLQVDILKEQCPQHFITHNFMGFKYDYLNYFDMAQDIDLVSWDNYWRTQWNMQANTDPSFQAIAHDAMRGLKGKNFWVMEQQSGSGGWEHISVPPRPGEIRLWTYQSIARGADGIVYFRWRTARYGTEQYWHGVLDHHGIPGRRYREIQQVGQEIGRLGDKIYGSLVKPVVAIISSYDSRFAFQVQGNNPRFNYPNHIQQVHRAFYRRQVPVDVVPPMADLSGYKVVVAPALHVLPEAAAENLKNHVIAGGLLLITPRSGVKDQFNAVVNQPLPGLLAELCGAEVEEYVSMPLDRDTRLQFLVPEMSTLPDVPAEVWCDLLKPGSATVVARYCQDYFAGKPAITLNQYGQGQVLYVGSLGDELYTQIVDWLLAQADIQPLLNVPVDIEVAERWQNDRRILFLLNYAEDERTVTLDKAYIDLLHDKAPVNNRVTIGPLEVLILAEAG